MRMWSRYSGSLSDRLPHAFMAFVSNPANAINFKFGNSKFRNSTFSNAGLPRWRPLSYRRLGERNGVTDSRNQ